MTKPLSTTIQDLREEFQKKVRETQMQLEVPTKIETKKPTNSQGVSGDKKVIKEGSDFYEYRKIEKEWYKVKLEKA